MNGGTHSGFDFSVVYCWQAVPVPGVLLDDAAPPRLARCCLIAPYDPTKVGVARCYRTGILGVCCRAGLSLSKRAERGRRDALCSWPLVLHFHVLLQERDG